MKKIYLTLTILGWCAAANAQNPGLVISEFMANPPSTDNSQEWVELVATRSIDFSSEPFCVVVSNNGTATANGWIQGANITYGFNITSGVVSTGDVVYVGGTSMLPAGPRVRQIDITTTAGDGPLGNATTGGVFGNGGSNADGIAVFSGLAGALSSSSVPVDAVFFGTGIGASFVSVASGYELPVNDLYPGGKLQTSSFFAGDPASGQTIKATGYYNITNNAWYGTRTWTLQSYGTDQQTDLQLVTVDPPGTASIAAAFQEVNENAGTINVVVTFANANTSQAKIRFDVSVYSDAAAGSDYTIASDTLYIPGSSSGTFQFPIQLTDDLLAEKSERIILKMTGAVNANIGPANFQVITVQDDDYVAPVSSHELQLQLLSSFSNGAEGTNSAEIVSYDSISQRLFIANSVGAKLDIVDFSNPSSPSLISSIDIATYGSLNSVVAHNGLVVAAVENLNPQANGFLVFFDMDGNFLNQVTVGAMPDMVTFNHDYSKVLTACEGEPNDAYTADPAGSVGIVDISGGIAGLTQANVAIADFNAFVGQEATLRAQGVRIYGPGATAAQDFEPEYITVSDDNATAYVTLQENNAVAVVDIATATVTAVRPLGYIDYSTGTNGLDASDQSAGIYIASGPFKGMYMPDAIAHGTIGGTEYLFSANEGDSRDYTGYSEVTRLSGANLDASIPDQNILKQNKLFGRINISTASGDTDNDGDLDEMYVYGGRSFSIWNAATGALVFDSKDLIEQITSRDPNFTAIFNASNTSGTAVAKNRSDDKGPEPEGVAYAMINGNNYLFVSMERIGGVMAFNIDDPVNPVYSGYYNNRTFAANGPDRGAEGIIFISAGQSPNGHQLMILANEVSSTLSVYQINTCVELAGGLIAASDTELCDGETAALTIDGAPGTSVQWLLDDAAIAGETGTSLTVSAAGNYRAYVSNSIISCADTSEAQAIVVHTLPAVAAGSDQMICAGTSVTLTGSGAAALSWNNSIQDGVTFAPASTMDYIVTGTDGNGCENTDTVTVTVNALPVVSAGADQSVCEGSSATLTGSGASALSWNNGIQDGVAFSPASTMDYIVTGTDGNGCENTDTVTVTVNGLPVVSAGADQSVCEGSNATLTGSGASTLSWNNGIQDGVTFAPASTMDYIVTGTDGNGCENTDTVTVTVNGLPLVSAGNDATVCQNQLPYTFTATPGFVSYSWNGTSGTNTFLASAGGTYTVTVTDANGCQNSDAATLTVDPCLGLNESESLAISIQPNPTNGSFTIVTGSTADLVVELFTTDGKSILKSTESVIDLSAYSNGTYLVKITQNGITAVSRVQKF